jgi:uncharacterized protein YdeI (YjbR/CyaY-like superfamily)
MKNDSETLCVTSRKAWRVWLSKHHDSESEIWLIYYKKESGKQRLSYDDAVEEALCFGWIDSIVRSLDDERYMQRFTPRKASSKWSPSNVNRMDRLIATGQMTAAGRAVYDKRKAESKKQKTETDGNTLPADLMAAVRADARAFNLFRNLPPGYIKTCLRWIDAAKRPETRERRIAEFVSHTAEGKRIGLK